MDSIPADPDWIRERWGGFTYLVVSRNEDFTINFEDGSLWLYFEGIEISRVLLFENPTQQNVMDAERVFGCK